MRDFFTYFQKRKLDDIFVQFKGTINRLAVAKITDYVVTTFENPLISHLIDQE